MFSSLVWQKAHQGAVGNLVVMVMVMVMVVVLWWLYLGYALWVVAGGVRDGGDCGASLDGVEQWRVSIPNQPPM